VLILVCLVYMLLSIDKSIIAVLGEPIRRAFSLNDRQLGLLNGFAYAVPFTVAAIPMGRLVDRASRKGILTISLAAWSLLTALGALAQSFVPLLLLRAAIGAAEAGGPTAMLSVITDTYDRDRRPRAVGIFYAAAPAGVVVGALGGSWVAATWGWRAALVVVGLPGLVLAGLLTLWLREPLRGRFDATAGQDKGNLREAATFILRHDRARLTLAAMTVNAAGAFATNYWITPLLMRSFGLGVGVAGSAGLFGLGVIGAIGSSLGGALVTRYLARRVERQFLFYAAAMIASVPMPLLQFVVISPGGTLSGFAIYAFLNALCFGPSFSLCLSYAPITIRGTVAGLVFLLVNLVGGVSSVLVGVLSDAFAAAGFHSPLGIAMAMLGLSGIASGACYLRAARGAGTFA
jgi:predicted MFS family arabinose efflux permease